MRNILLIAKREYLEQIRGRAFRISTVMVPVIFVVIAAAGYLTGIKGNSHKHLVIAANDPVLATDLQHQLIGNKNLKYGVDVVAPVTPQERENLLRSLRNNKIDGVLLINDSSVTKPVATYISQSSNNFETVALLKNALAHSLVLQRLIAKGMTLEEANNLLKTIPVKTFQIVESGRERKSGGYAALGTGLIMALLLTMTTMLYGLDTARSIIEEKSSRIFEVMLSVVKPNDLLAGKLVGVGAVGLTQIGIWIFAAALLVLSALAAPLLKGNFAIHFSWAEAVLFLVFFILGFFLYSSLFSGLAATCETSQELQMYMPLAAIPVWISFGIIPLLMANPDSVWIVVASFFPLTAPFVMMLRMGVLSPPAWQYAVSIVIMFLSTWGALWFSTRLYRVGVLMYGKRATLSEMMRWLRYS